MEFKGRCYNELYSGFKIMNDLLNQLPISKTTGSYIDGIPVSKINTQEVLDKHKWDKSSKLPNFLDYFKAGVNLSVTMNNCPTMEPELKALVKLVEDYSNGQFKDNLPLISYSAKDKQFKMNADAAAALDHRMIKLDSKQTKIFNAVKSLSDLIFSEYGKNACDDILSDRVYFGMFDGALKEEDLINIIIKHSK